MKNEKIRAVTNVSDNVDAAIDVFQLEAQPSERMLRFCEENHISMVCLLMMGLRTYLQKENGNDDVSIVTTVARRATLLEKKAAVQESIVSRSAVSFPEKIPLWKDC